MDWSALIPDAPFDWALIPVGGNKRPIDPATGEVLKEWQKQDGFTPEELTEMNGVVKAVGLMLGPPSGGILAVDFDGPEAVAKFTEVFDQDPLALPSTVGVTSGKEQRGQRFFLVDQDWWPALRGRRAWKGEDGSTCLELRWAGHQSVIAGAHPETKGYRWLPHSSPSDIDVAAAPDWLLTPLLHQEQDLEPVEITAQDAERAIKMLACINPQQRTSYDDWLAVGMALHNTDPGLLNAWVDWARPMPNFDEAEHLRKWESFGKSNRTGGRTIRSLHFWAKQGGYKEPAATAEPDSFNPDDPDEQELIAEQLQLNERLAQGRSLFTLDQLLPANLASSVELLNQSLPTDDLSATMLLLAGYSGLLKLGTRVSSSVGFSVPANLFVAGVMPSGGSKTQAKKRLIDAPAKEIRKQAARDHNRQMKDWEQTPKNDRPPAPQPVFPHLSDYTPAALSKQLQLNEERGLGQLIINDELSGLFGALLADAQRGTGRAESQILEAFDGEGFSSVRIESAPRNYESCHVSIYGNIQPDLLKDLINHQDVTGKFARFLFVRIPRGPLQLLDDDPTDAQIQAFEAAEQVLAQYAHSLFTLTPRTYRFEQEARKRFHAWFHEHQIRAGLRGCPSVISALLGKTSAHALRIAGMLHLLRVAAGELEPSDRISSATVDQAMAIVDQLTQETEAFHEQESSQRALLLTHIHQLSWDTGKPVSRVDARSKGGNEVRNELKAEAWPGIIQQLADLDFGVVEEKRSANGRRSQLYRAIKPMA